MEDYYHKSTNRPKIFGMTAPQSEKVSRPLKIQGFKGNVVRFISVVQYGNFLQEVLSIIEGSHGYKKLLKFVNSGSGALSTGQISSKLHGLLEIFRSFGFADKKKIKMSQPVQSSTNLARSRHSARIIAQTSVDAKLNADFEESGSSFDYPRK